MAPSVTAATGASSNRLWQPQPNYLTLYPTISITLYRQDHRNFHQSQIHSSIWMSFGPKI
ncbi:hypothetical protein CCACVL1_30558 [Corchorus capsularis]|uniref:Uncharacterized protein n=1 Tax=Corchorus capsularis TaxID=210143 RepID=A0A1R3FWS8_COCAP|nr:hypothetical protein CCACVL1_30558 [Corchorus capsularis]